MFFGLFNKRKRTAKPKRQPQPGRTPGRSSWTATEPSRLTQPSSLEVTEGNDSTDWALWQDSVNCLDSQLRSLQPSVELHEPNPATPTGFEDVDVFARVRRRDV